MAKWFGKIGYASTIEVSPGVWKGVTEREYYGDILQYTRSLRTSNGVNDNVSITNELSIVADPFAYDNFQNIRYAEFMGVNYKVSSIRVDRPRLTLTLGDVYNGEQA